MSHYANKFKNRNGTLTAYALGCGYVDLYAVPSGDNGNGIVSLWRDKHSTCYWIKTSWNDSDSKPCQPFQKAFPTLRAARAAIREIQYKS